MKKKKTKLQFFCGIIFNINSCRIQHLFSLYLFIVFSVNSIILATFYFFPYYYCYLLNIPSEGPPKYPVSVYPVVRIFSQAKIKNASVSTLEARFFQWCSPAENKVFVIHLLEFSFPFTVKGKPIKKVVLLKKTDEGKMLNHKRRQCNVCFIL